MTNAETGFTDYFMGPYVDMANGGNIPENVTFIYDFERNGHTFVATMPVKKGEEIFLNYGICSDMQCY
jgi:hypothetical protein